MKGYIAQLEVVCSELRYSHRAGNKRGVLALEGTQRGEPQSLDDQKKGLSK